MPVQKQTRAGQRTRFKAFVAIGDSNGHIGLGVKCSKEVATAIRGAIILAKLSVIPVRRGYWGNKIGKPHTVPCKVCLPKLWSETACDVVVCPRNLKPQGAVMPLGFRKVKLETFLARDKSLVFRKLDCH